MEPCKKTKRNGLEQRLSAAQSMVAVRLQHSCMSLSTFFEVL